MKEEDEGGEEEEEEEEEEDGRGEACTAVFPLTAERLGGGVEGGGGDGVDRRRAALAGLAGVSCTCSVRFVQGE